MIFKRLLITMLTTCCLLGAGKVMAQQSDQEEEETMVLDEGGVALYQVPQTLLKRGWRMDVEWFIKDSDHSLTLAPIYYSGTLDNDDDQVEEDDRLEGYGAELIHKYYVDKFEDVNAGFYFGHGPYFRKFNIRYKAFGWETVQRDGLEVYEYNKQDQTREITKLGYSFLLGVNVVPANSLIFEFYGGTGIRTVNTSSTLGENNPNRRSFQNNFMDYGYEGPVLLLGMKFGVLFN